MGFRVVSLAFFVHCLELFLELLFNFPCVFKQGSDLRLLRRACQTAFYEGERTIDPNGGEGIL